MKPLSHKIYLWITDADSKELDRDDDLHRHAPANFLRLLVARTGSKISDRLSNPKTTLAWLLQTLGAPSIFLGLIVPVREAGALLPQLLLGRHLKRYQRRKFAWSLGAGLQGLAMGGCAIAGLTLEGVAAGATILSLVVLFSLARAISSVSAKDVLGKSLPKSKRGQLTGWAGSTSGIIAMAAAAMLWLQPENGDSTAIYAIFLTAAAMIWWLSALLNLRVNEPSGETQEVPAFKNLRKRLGLLRSDAHFRDFLIVRSLAIGSGLATPYLISLAHGRLGGDARWLGTFIIVEGLAAMLSGPVWGRLADRSSSATLRGSMALVCLLLLGSVAYVVLSESGPADGLVFPLLLFINGLAHAGVRTGRKTHLVNLGEGNKRTDYVSLANSLIGLQLLVAGVLTGLVAMHSMEWALVLFAVAAALGAGYGRRLKE